MARDAKPDEIELKKRNFSTDKQELAADRLLEHWDGNITYKDLEAQYGDISASLYRKVFDEYFGMPGDDRTIEELRAQFGSIKQYLEQRKYGNIELDKTELTESELTLYKEGFKEGYKEGLADSTN